MNPILRRAGIRRGLARLALATLVLACGTASAQTLTLVRRIEPPFVQGRIDHLAVDEEGGRLFVAALGSDSVEVVDLRAGQRIARINTPREPQGVLYLPSSKRLIVANGAGEGVQAFADAKPPAVAGQPTLDDADNLRWDAGAGTLYVGFGTALAELDAGSLRIKRRIELAAHPESFQIERLGHRIYVNVPTAGHIAVVNRDSGKVEASWALEDAARNYPMALDETGQRLFVVTRIPAKLLTYDTAWGRLVDRASTCGDADDVFFDEKRQLLFVICGEGAIDVMRREGERLVVATHMPTSARTRTGLFVPGTSRLYVAAPARGNTPAQILEFQVQ